MWVWVEEYYLNMFDAVEISFYEWILLQEEKRRSAGVGRR